MKETRGAIFFFRDDQLTTQVQVTPGVLDRVARDREPELDRVLAANRLGAFSDVHRAAREAYQYDRTRLWAEPHLVRAPAAWVSDTPEALLTSSNTELFALERLRPFAASDLAQGSGAALDFNANINGSLLPEIVRLANASGIKLAFIRAQRRPTAQGPPPQSEPLKKYTADLEAWLEARGVYFYDDWGDPDTPLSMYADGDHLNSTGKLRYTERFAEKHARFLQ